MIVGRNPSVLQGVPAHFLDNTINYIFNNKPYSIPKDYRDYLTYLYGDWKTPVKNWDFTKDAKTNKRYI